VTNLNQNEPVKENQIQVFPNPISDNKLYFNANGLAEKKGLIALTDITGRIVLSQEIQVNNQNNEIILPVLNNGLYILLIEVDSNLMSYKINIQH
jgi:hypothetical protein